MSGAPVSRSKITYQDIIHSADILRADSGYNDITVAGEQRPTDAAPYNVNDYWQVSDNEIWLVIQRNGVKLWARAISPDDLVNLPDDVMRRNQPLTDNYIDDVIEQYLEDNPVTPGLDADAVRAIVFPGGFVQVGRIPQAIARVADIPTNDDIDARITNWLNDGTNRKVLQTLLTTVFEFRSQTDINSLISLATQDFRTRDQIITLIEQNAPGGVSLNDVNNRIAEIVKPYARVAATLISAADLEEGQRLPTIGRAFGDIMYWNGTVWTRGNLTRVLMSDETKGLPLVSSITDLDSSVGYLGRVSINTSVLPGGETRGLTVNSLSRIEGMLMTFSGDVNNRSGTTQHFITDTGSYRRTISSTQPETTNFNNIDWETSDGGSTFVLPDDLTAFRGNISDVGIITTEQAFADGLINERVLANNSVSTNKIQDDAVTEPKLSQALRSLIRSATGGTGETIPVQHAVFTLKARTQASHSDPAEGWVVGGASGDAVNIGGENLHYHTQLTASQSTTTVQFDIPNTATHAVAFATRGGSHNLVPVYLGDLQGIVQGNTRGYSSSENTNNNQNDIRVRRLQEHFRVTLSDASPHLERLFLVQYTRNVDLHAIRGADGERGEKGDKGDKGDTGDTGRAGRDGDDATHIEATDQPVTTGFSRVAHSAPGGGQVYVQNTDANFGAYIAPPQDGHSTSISDNVWLTVPGNARIVVLRVAHENNEPVNDVHFLPANFNGAIRGGIRSVNGHPIATRIENVAGTIEVGLRGSAHNLRLYDIWYATELTLSAIRGLDGGSIDSVTYVATTHVLRIMFTPPQTLTNRNPVSEPIDIPLPASTGLSQNEVDERIRILATFITGATYENGVLTITRSGTGTAPITVNIPRVAPWAQLGNDDKFPNDKYEFPVSVTQIQRFYVSGSGTRLSNVDTVDHFNAAAIRLIGADDFSTLSGLASTGEQLYGVFSLSDGPGSRLCTINPVNGIVTPVNENNTVAANVFSMEYHNGVMYALDDGGSLNTIDLATGTISSSIPLSTPGASTSSSFAMRAIVSQGGVLYAAGSRLRGQTSACYFCSVNTTNGQCTRIGTSNDFGVGEEQVYGLASDGTTVYLAGQISLRLATIDLTTGLATLLEGRATAFIFPQSMTYHTYTRYSVGTEDVGEAIVEAGQGRGSGDGLPVPTAEDTMLVSDGAAFIEATPEQVRTVLGVTPGGGGDPALADNVVHSGSATAVALPANFAEYKIIDVSVNESGQIFTKTISTGSFNDAEDGDHWQTGNVGTDYFQKASLNTITVPSGNTITRVVLRDFGGVPGSSSGGNPNVIRRVDGFASVINGIESENVAFRITGNAVLALPAGEYLLEAYEDSGTGNDTTQRATNFTTNEVFTRHNLSGEWTSTDLFTKISGFKWSANLLDGSAGRTIISSTTPVENIRNIPELEGARVVKVEAGSFVSDGVFTNRESDDIIDRGNNTFAHRIDNDILIVTFSFPSATQIRADFLGGDNRVIGVYVYK